MNKTGEFIRQIGEILNSKSGEILFRKSGEQICDDSTKRESRPSIMESVLLGRDLRTSAVMIRILIMINDHDHAHAGDAGAVFKTGLMP